jgi:hypothetical protein
MAVQGSNSNDEPLRRRLQDQAVAREHSPVLTPYEIAMREGLIGCVDDAPPDLNTNPACMEGFGKPMP